MKNYDKTLWENNKTIVDAEKLNNIEDQIQIITNTVIEDSQQIEVIKETLPMKANINHIHDNYASNTEVDSIRENIETMSNTISSNQSDIEALTNSINVLKTELQEEFKKYYDNAEIEDNVLKLYSNNVLLTSLTLPVGQAPALKSICGDFLCGDLNCDDYEYNTLSSRSYERTIWQNGVTPVNADNLNKIENKLLELSDKLKELSETGVDLADNFIHTGSNEPDTTKGLWIDESDEEELFIADPLLEQIAEVLNKHQKQIDELFYLTDAYLDDGLFEEEDDETENLDGGIF